MTRTRISSWHRKDDEDEDEDEDVQGSSVPSFSNKQIKKGFTTTTHCDDNEISFLISRFRNNPDVSTVMARAVTFLRSHFRCVTLRCTFVVTRTIIWVCPEKGIVGEY